MFWIAETIEPCNVLTLNLSVLSEYESPACGPVASGGAGRGSHDTEPQHPDGQGRAAAPSSAPLDPLRLERFFTPRAPNWG